MQIVDLFYQLAKEHIKINSFFYGKAYEKGAGEESHPCVWLDDPVAFDGVTESVVQWTVNLDILGIPANASEVIGVQSAALDVGLEFIEKIRAIRANTGFSIVKYSGITLRDYYDNNAAGMRFTFSLSEANPVNRCVNPFDPNKGFVNPSYLPNFATDNAQGCAVFTDKTSLPSFKTDSAHGCAVFKTEGGGA